MGLFDMIAAQSAHGQVYNDERHHSDWTHELVAGAAGFEAMRMYEHHREREGITEHHALGKEMVAGFALAEVEKHFKNKGLNHMDRDQARRQASEQAEYLYDQQYQPYHQ
jgi:Protein of unknown function (DUF3759)